MRHRNKTTIIGRKIGPRKALLKTLASSLLVQEKIETTALKAKTVRTLVEKSITTSKKNNLAAKRKLVATLNKEAAEKTFTSLGKRYQDRPGGYTRIVKLKNRLGDGAPVVRIELV